MDNIYCDPAIRMTSFFSEITFYGHDSYLQNELAIFNPTGFPRCRKRTKVTRKPLGKANTGAAENQDIRF